MQQPEQKIDDAQRLLVLTHELEEAWKRGDLDAVEALLGQRGETIERLAARATASAAIDAAIDKGGQMLADWADDRDKVSLEMQAKRKGKSARNAYKSAKADSGLKKAS